MKRRSFLAMLASLVAVKPLSESYPHFTAGGDLHHLTNTVHVIGAGEQIVFSTRDMNIRPGQTIKININGRILADQVRVVLREEIRRGRHVLGR